MLELKDYQSKAVEELNRRAVSILTSGAIDTHSKTCTFESPTGSGKTVVMASLIEKLSTEYTDASLSFVWVAPRKLDVQSKEKLENIYGEDGSIICSQFDDLDDNVIKPNEVLFVNWDSLNKSKNNVRRIKNERGDTIDDISNNTRETNTLILIIDESHFAATTDNATEVIGIIKPTLILDMSATPILRGANAYPVQIKKVIEEEMIKYEIEINPRFSEIEISSGSDRELVIQEAIDCRNRLTEMYEQENSTVNPLLLIQLPNENTLDGDLLEPVIAYLESIGITADGPNPRLAIYLEDNKKNIDTITNNNDSIDVLIFKEALTLGWDCPRAHVLVILREFIGFNFTIQTIGRIMRMPELKHYKNDELNKGYVFSNLQTIELGARYINEYVSKHISYKRPAIEPISIKSTFVKHSRLPLQLTSEFESIFNSDDTIKQYMDKVKFSHSPIANTIYADSKIHDMDKETKIKPSKSLVVEITDENEIQREFDTFIRNVCGHFAPNESSSFIKETLYSYINKKDNTISAYSLDAQEIVLANENRTLFTNSIKIAQQQFISKHLEKTKSELFLENTKWNIPTKMMCVGNCNEIEQMKSVMDHVFVNNISGIENRFIQVIDASSSVKWWFKNGVSQSKYFSIPYTDENNNHHGFFVDFIIKFETGQIGLFDTKEGYTAAMAKNKHNALYNYINEENNRQNNIERIDGSTIQDYIIGGILVENNGIWRYNTNRDYAYNPDNLESWSILTL